MSPCAQLIDLDKRRDLRRFEHARVALIRARNVPEPIRSMQREAEEFADRGALGACNAYRSYANV